VARFNTRIRKIWVARSAWWLAGRFERTANPAVDREIAAWGEFMGRSSAELWAADCRRART